jgi:chemotaxis protein MotB
LSGHKPARHKKHAAHDEEHENHERWLVSYADMMTLLMVLFVVLFAMSQVDQKKFTALREGLAKGFGAPTVLSGSGNTVQDQADDAGAVDIASGVGGNPDNPPTKSQSASGAQDAALQKAVQDSDRARQQRMQTDAQQEVQSFDEVKKKILEQAAQKGTADSVRFTIDERGLVVTIVTSGVVFAGDRAELLPDGQRILDSVAPALVSLPNHVEVDGHTNQLNVPTVNYPSAWELSTARASGVVRYLIGKGIPPERLSAAGYAGEKPLYLPSDPRAATLNRRVEIVVQSSLPAAERALLPSAAGAK